MKIRNIILIGIFMIVLSMIFGKGAIRGEERIKQPDPKASFTGKYSDYKTYDTETGLSFIKVDVEVAVKKEGDYHIQGWLNGATVKFGDEYIYVNDSKILHLTPGLHTITLSFDGRTIFKGEFKSFSLELWLVLAEKDPDYTVEAFVLDDKRGLSLSKEYNWQEFQQAKATPKDKNKTYGEITGDLLFSCGYSWPRKEPAQTEEASLKEVFGPDIVPSKYKLYYGSTFRGMIPPQKVYVTIAIDKSQAFIIDNMENFNDFISSLNLSLQNYKEIINFTQTYLEMLPYWNVTPEILWQLPKRKEDKGWGGGFSFRMWFLTHIKYRFYPPKVNKIKEDYSVEFYSWEENAGILKHHYFELKENGEIIKHLEKRLGERVGPYITI